MVPKARLDSYLIAASTLHKVSCVASSWLRVSEELAETLVGRLEAEDGHGGGDFWTDCVAERREEITAKDVRLLKTRSLLPCLRNPHPSHTQLWNGK